MDIDPQVGDNLGTMPAECKSLCSVLNVLSVQKYSIDLRDQCVCNDPLICRCPSTSASMLSDVPMLSDVSMLSDVPMPAMTSMNIIRDIFFGHRVAHSHISVFHTDLPTIQRALLLHAIPHTNPNLIQCCCVLIHHIATGACADHAVDAATSPRPDRSACRALCQDFESE